MTPAVWVALIWAVAAVLVTVIACAALVRVTEIRSKGYVN